jgi:hypothetical protein
MVMAVMTKYFPAPGAPELYCNKPSEYNAATDEETFKKLVPADLADKLSKTGRLPAAGDVKYIFSTRSGPGPTSQPDTEALLDLVTGMPRAPGPKHRRMRLA